jgi:hypothetical protein
MIDPRDAGGEGGKYFQRYREGIDGEIISALLILRVLTKECYNIFPYSIHMKACK